MTIIRELSDKSANAKANGGKIMGLAQLLSYGLPIPKTFFIAPKDSSKMNSPKFISELKNTLRAFPKNTQLAIRSSAIGEDGGENSFAGIFDTELNIDSSNEKNVLAAISKVVESASSEKTKSYKNKKRAKMGIIIQEMIAPLFAGVSFTDSLSETGENAVLIEFVDGLGDKLVSGRANSHRVTIPYDDKGSLDKSKVKFFNNDSGKKQISFALDELINNIENVRKKFGRPMDTEWAIDKNGKTWMLQARPITKQVFVPVENNFADAGIVASYGKGAVSGKTYFVDGDLDEGEELDNSIAKMPEGAILILTYSDTYYLSAMRKAKAIISTNGSILAHAAIVSRELGIPCMVGVKDADKHFPDGTEVAINPSKGEIISKNYSVRGNNSDIEWGELDLYDNIAIQKIDNTDVLFERLDDGTLAVHLPEKVTPNLINNVERYSRINYHASPKIYQREKYLWYFENKRFANLPLFVEFYAKGRGIVESLNSEAMNDYFSELVEIAKALVRKRRSTKIAHEKLLCDENIQAAHFAAAIKIAQGDAIKHIYNFTKDILKRNNMNFIDFASLKGGETVIKKNAALGSAFEFLKVTEKRRNEIYQKLLDIKAVSSDYFDKRKARARQCLNIVSKQNEQDLMNEFYKQFVKKNLISDEF
jgi:phosphohistidine swiveling domain-containing protein